MDTDASDSSVMAWLRFHGVAAARVPRCLPTIMTRGGGALRRPWSKEWDAACLFC